MKGSDELPMLVLDASTPRGQQVIERLVRNFFPSSEDRSDHNIDAYRDI